LAAEGEFALVRHHLEAALTLTGEWVGDHDLYAMLADAAGRQRDAAALRQYAPLAEESADRYTHRLYQAIVHRAWGVAHMLAGEFDAAEARLNQALTLFGALDTHWQIGRTHFELGELARAHSGHSAGRDNYAKALVEFETIGAAPDAMRVRKVVDQLS